MARGKRAPKTEPRARGARGLAPVFGIAVFAVGLLVTAMGVFDPFGGTALIAARAAFVAGSVTRRHTSLVRAATVDPPSPRISPLDAIRRDPPRRDTEAIDRPTAQQHFAVMRYGRPDRRRDLARAALMSRRSPMWIDPPPQCTPTSCQSGDRPPGQSVPRW